MEKIKLTHDKEITIATAKSHISKHWQNKSMMISELFSNLGNPHRTNETVEEFKNADKDTKNKIKNCIGGFVGGALKQNGARTKENIQNRILITLDIDQCNKSIEEYLKDLDCLYCIYSTHSHREDYQRYRLIIPLDREVTPIEYEAAARMQASKIDETMNIFDDTTYQPIRLMYWSSIPKDADYYFKYNDGPLLKADEILDEYFLGWDDIESWPRSQREINKIHDTVNDKQQDPLTKKGIIGAFCRTYSITAVITNFLDNVYELSDDARGTYKVGTTTGGLIIYDNKFSYSFHSTDPTSCILCNAFDLVRIHKFGNLDQEVKKGRPSKELPSFKAMAEFAKEDKNVLATIDKERAMSAQEEFDAINTDEEISTEWLKELEHTEQGKIKSTISNFRIIIENEPFFKDKLRYDEFTLRLKVVGQLPWRDKGNLQDWADTDDSGLREFIEKYYGLSSAQKCNDALQNTFEKHKFHPIKEYIESIPWDGQKRVETLFIDYLGAEDNEYSRLVASKILVGAVKRIYEPGCKFELIPILQGSQGKGKSTLVKKLGKQWSTSVDAKLLTLRDKELSENTQGMWIIEWAEYGANKKNDSMIKSLLSKDEDNYRPAYGRRTVLVKRQFIMIATTNNIELLTDSTGDRRFLPLQVYITNPKKDVFDNDAFMPHISDEVQQIWAEAYYLYKNEYRAYLNTGEYEMIDKYKEPFRETDPMYDDFVNYMDKPVCENWYDLKLDERVAYLWGDVTGKSIPESEQIPRYRVCLQAIYDEFIVQRYATTFSNLKDSERVIKSYLQKLKWSKKTGGDSGRLKFGVYERQVAYLKH